MTPTAWAIVVILSVWCAILGCICVDLEKHINRIHRDAQAAFKSHHYRIRDLEVVVKRLSEGR